MSDTKQSGSKSHIKHKSDESVEDYLETILLLSQKNGNVRSIDIASELGFSKPSVSVAMKNLREKNYIEVSANGIITLTQEGLTKATKTLERHTLISDWLIRLGVSKETALEDACRIEHDISEETFEVLKDHCIKPDNL